MKKYLSACLQLIRMKFIWNILFWEFLGQIQTFKFSYNFHILVYFQQFYIYKNPLSHRDNLTKSLELKLIEISIAAKFR